MSILQRKLSQNAISRIAGLDVPKFCGGTFAGGFQTTIFVKIFSLERFPLYGINWKSAIWSYFSSYLISLSIKLEVPNYWKKHSAYTYNGIINYY